MPEPSAPTGTARAAGLLPKSRLEAFADGVLAIVITLLVLELQVPPVEETGELWRALTDASCRSCRS